MGRQDKIKEKAKAKAETPQGGEHYLGELKKTILWLVAKIDEYQIHANSSAYPKHYLDYHLSKLFVDSFLIDILAICEFLYISNEWIKKTLIKNKEYVEPSDLNKLKLKPLILWKFMAEWKKHPFRGYLDIGMTDDWKPNPTIEEQRKSLLIKQRDFGLQAIERCQLWNGEDIVLVWPNDKLNKWCDEYKKHYQFWYDFIHFTKFFCPFRDKKASDGKTLYIQMLHPKNADPSKWNAVDKTWFKKENDRRSKNISLVRGFFAWLYCELNKEKTKSLFETKVFANKYNLWNKFLIYTKAEKNEYIKINLNDYFLK